MSSDLDVDAAAGALDRALSLEPVNDTPYLPITKAGLRFDLGCGDTFFVPSDNIKDPVLIARFRRPFRRSPFSLDGCGFRSGRVGCF